MTAHEILTFTRSAGIMLEARSDRLHVEAPTGAMTPELHVELTRHKPTLLQVLPRLEGMRRTLGQVPVPCARLEACGGPGRCFSCGDALGHPQAYGRCVPCDIACEIFYRECPDAANRWQPAREPARREPTR